MRKTIIAAFAAGLLLAACGGDDSGDTADSTPAAETTAPAAETTAATTATSASSGATETTAAGTAATTAAPGSTAATTPSPSIIPVSLKEWSIETGTIAPGQVTFEVKNEGQARHELVVIKGKYATLPQQSNGSVDETKLPAGAIVASTDPFDGGTSKTLSANLAAGDYTFICNITGGGSSHAARGQVLDVTVA